jgi:N-acetylmuramoyl-L-alanine amidase CwlA
MYSENLLPLYKNRSGTKLKKAMGIVIHYVASAGGRAAAVRNNFIKWAEQNPPKYASCHDIIDLNGDILHIIPYDEVAYHVGSTSGYVGCGQWFERHFGNPNNCLIGIEMCHPDESAKPTPETRQAAIDLCADLCKQYNFNPINDIYLHNDITGKICHKYYCDYPDEWWTFRNDVQNKINAKVDE